MSRAGPGYSRMLATVENSRNKSQTVRSEYNSSTIREEETVTVGSVVLPSVAKKNENL